MAAYAPSYAVGDMPECAISRNWRTTENRSQACRAPSHVNRQTMTAMVPKAAARNTVRACRRTKAVSHRRHADIAGASKRKICALNSKAAAVTNIPSHKHAGRRRELQTANNVSAVNAALKAYPLPGDVNNDQ